MKHMTITISILAAICLTGCVPEEKELPVQIPPTVVAPEVPSTPPKLEPKINDQCVKRLRDGTCPPLPNSPKPTPKIPFNGGG